jgi:hypothetical protein
MIYMLIILLVVMYRHDIMALISVHDSQDDLLEIYGGLDYQPTIDQ